MAQDGGQMVRNSRILAIGYSKKLICQHVPNYLERSFIILLTRLIAKL
jgi:hypothetical protein